MVKAGIIVQRRGECACDNEWNDCGNCESRQQRTTRERRVGTGLTGSANHLKNANGDPRCEASCRDPTGERGETVNGLKDKKEDDPPRPHCGCGGGKVNAVPAQKQPTPTETTDREKNVDCYGESKGGQNFWREE
jgi:hypothetical protein